MNNKILAILKAGFAYQEESGGNYFGACIDGHKHLIYYNAQTQSFIDNIETFVYDMDILQEQKGLSTEFSEQDFLQKLDTDLYLSSKMDEMLNEKIFREICRLMNKGYSFRTSGGSTDYGQTVGVVTTIKYNKDTKQYDYECFTEIIIGGKKESEETQTQSYTQKDFEKWINEHHYLTMFTIWETIQTEMQSQLYFALHDLVRQHIEIQFNLETQELFTILSKDKKTTIIYKSTKQEADLSHYFNKKYELVEELLRLLSQQKYTTI